MVDVDGNVAPRLDTRILNKIPLLQGRDTAEFRSWQFVLKASLGLVDTSYSTDLPHVEAMRSPMTQPENADTKARSEKLYFILALTTADHAQVIVQQVESGHGYEAYRRLVEAYDPATSMRGLSMIEGILMAKFTSKNYLSQLQDWRLRVTRYEQKMGRALDDDVKVSVLLRNAPETIRRQLQLNAEREGYTFEALYRHITGYMQLQTNYSDAGRLGGGSLGGAVAQDDAMDVGGVTAGKGEKGKGKGKLKGKSKGGKAQRSKDVHACEKCGKTNHTTAECTYFDGACRYCGVHGHRERDCRKKQAASKNSGETAAVVTTPGPTTGQVAFVERRQRQLEDESGWILGVMREITKEPWTKTVGAVEFIVDSGSEATILNTGLADKHGVDRAKSSASLYHIGGGDLNCSTRGSLHGQLRDEKWGPFPVALECHVGDVQRNVLSVSRLVDQGCNVNFGPDGCWIRHKGRCVNLHRQGGLFTLRVERPSGRKGQEAQMVAPVAMDDAEDEPSDELPEWLQPFNPDDYLEEESEREGLADAEGFHAPAGPDARAVTTPATPTEAERRAHAIAHLPYRGWCEHCVSGKGVEEPHFRQDAGASMERVVQIDYSFYGSTAAICSEREAVRKVLVAVDTDTGMVYQIMCRTKGRQDQYVVAGICKFLTDLRCSDIVLQSDGEYPIRSIVAAIAQTAREKHGLVIRERRAPKFSHQSQGSVEATIRHCRGHFRTLRSALENETGLEISMAHDIAPWLVRHAGWLISRFQPKAEKRSAYFRVHGVEYTRPLVEFGEYVLFRDNSPASLANKARSPWNSGVWLGRSDATDENIIGTASGVKLIRTIRRRPVGEQYSAEAIQSMRGVPWQLTTGHADTTKTTSSPTAVPMPATFPPAPSSSAPTPVIAPEVSQQDQHQPEGLESPESQQSSSSSSSSSSDQSDMQAESQIVSNGGKLDLPPSPRPSSITRSGMEMVDDANKRYKVMSIIDRSQVENLPVTEEALDLEAMNALATEKKQDAEISYLRQNDSYEVWSNADRIEYMKNHPNAKLLTIRWVVTEKARLVVREYNTWRTQEFFAATGNPMAQRVIPTIAVKRGYNTMVLDAVRAYLQVPENDDIFIIPPAEWKRHDDFKAHSCWKAKTVWYGERHAAQAFQDFLAGHLCEMGGTRGKRDPTKFVFLERCLYLETHVDDAHCTGPDASMQWLYETLLQRGVKLKPVTILGQGQTYEYLQRRYTRVPEGMLIEPSLRYVEETLQDLDLDSTSKVVSAPGLAKNLLDKDTGEKMLDASRAKTYASCVMRLVYLAQDRVDILHTVRQLSKSVSKPTEESWARLKRLGRYLVGHPRSQTLLRASGNLDVLYAISDSDWAADVESRKSTSCGVLTVDGAVQGVYSRGQTTIAQSSGEAEFYGAASVINEAIGLSGVYDELGIPMTIVLQLDSTAAIGMIQRRGTGRARHMDLPSFVLARATS